MRLLWIVPVAVAGVLAGYLVTRFEGSEPVIGTAAQTVYGRWRAPARVRARRRGNGRRTGRFPARIRRRGLPAQDTELRGQPVHGRPPERAAERRGRDRRRGPRAARRPRQPDRRGARLFLAGQRRASPSGDRRRHPGPAGRCPDGSDLRQQGRQRGRGVSHHRGRRTGRHRSRRALLRGLSPPRARRATGWLCSRFPTPASRTRAPACWRATGPATKRASRSPRGRSTSSSSPT